MKFLKVAQPLRYHCASFPTCIEPLNFGLKENFIEILGKDKILPIIRTKDVDKAIEVSKAIADGGVRIIEINVESRIYNMQSFVYILSTDLMGGFIL